jgi:hypothetical protein
MLAFRSGFRFPHKNFLLSKSGPALIRVNPTRCTYFSLSSQKQLRRWIKRFNEAVVSFPTTSLVFFLAFRAVTWYILTGIFAFTLEIGPELAVGFLVAKFSHKFRQPVNVSVAAFISHKCPVLQEIQASALLGLIELPIKEDHDAVADEKLKKLQKFFSYLKGPVDKYGFSLFLAAKINILLTILCTAGALKNGMDISAILSSWGIDSSLQNGAGAMGAATLTNMLFLPVHLWLLPVLTPFVYQQVENLRKVGEPQKK